MGEQTSFTDDLYDVDIKIAKLYKELQKIEVRVHFIRSLVSIIQTYSHHTPEKHLHTSKVIRELTSALDWISDLQFYLEDSSCDIESKSLSSYKKLRDMENAIQRKVIVDKTKLAEEMLSVRIDLFRLFDEYDKYVDAVKPCMTVYENLIDVVRVAAREIKKI